MHICTVSSFQTRFRIIIFSKSIVCFFNVFVHVNTHLHFTCTHARTHTCTQCTVSLNEFGKHMPKNPSKQPPAENSTKNDKSGEDVSDGIPPGEGQGTEDMFSTEFLSEMESQLGEAMKVMSNENPELWQQLDTFSKSLGIDDLGPAPFPHASGTATKGESSVDSAPKHAGDAGKGAEEGGSGGSASDEGKEGGGSHSLEHVLEETLKKLQQNTAKMVCHFIW